MRGLRVVSLFDGSACGMAALERCGFKVDRYWASEIDKYAMTVALNNYPFIEHIGDVTQVNGLEFEDIDLLIGGSPCQGFSFAGKQLNFEDPRSKLFFEFVRLRDEIQPKYFFLENVVMKKEYQDVISRILGVEPIKLNSDKVSAQRRPRLYWTNIPNYTEPVDREVFLEDITLSGRVDQDKSFCIDANYFKKTTIGQYLTKNRRQIVWEIPEATVKGYVEVKEGDYIDLTFINSKTRRGHLMLEKSNCLTASPFKYCKVTKDWFRMLTPVECERLQTLPDNYTIGVSNSQRYKMLGNGWTVDAVVEFFKNIPIEEIC
jgi:site-specific DNA-cytosine methylase